MRRLVSLALVPLALLTTGAAAQRDRDDVPRDLRGRAPGKPVSCIGLSSTSGPQIVDRNTILYREGSRVWRTQPIGRCPSLRPLATLIVRVQGGQLCRNDRFQVIDPPQTIPGPFCRFDRFTPYVRPGRTR